MRPLQILYPGYPASSFSFVQQGRQKCCWSKMLKCKQIFIRRRTCGVCRLFSQVEVPMGTNTGTDAVIPGISDAGELDNGGKKGWKSGVEDPDKNEQQARDEEQRRIEGIDGAGDKEAVYKNLIFHGVPNCTVSDTEGHQVEQEEEDAQNEQHEAESYPEQELKQDVRQSRTKSFIQDQQFEVWRKEFKEAFRKVATFSRFKSPWKQQHQQPQSQPQNPQHLLNEKDLYTQKLASDLIDSLLAGCPAALFPSCQFLRDEHGQKRAPMLLAMLGVRVEPYTPRESSSDKTGPRSRGNNDTDDDTSSIFSQAFEPSRNEEHTKKLFKLQLEYGIGENRLKWHVIKSYKDLNNLHNKLKLVSFQQNTLNKIYIDHYRFNKMHIPHFPRLGDRERNLMNSSVGNGRQDHQNSSQEERNPLSASSLSPTSSRSSLSSMRSSLNFAIDKFKVKHLQDLIEEEDDYNQPMYLRLERYLRLLNIALSVRPQANRLFQFYELSPIGNLLSYEVGLQGKQGQLIIRSTAKSQGWRVSHFSFNDLREMIERHTTKWFLVRHSYILYVSDLCSTTPLDVFLVDSQFHIKWSGNKKQDYNVNINDTDLNQDNKRKISTKLLITLSNSERKLQVICKSEASLKQWVSSISHMVKNTIWSKPHRFDSFAPVRKNAFCKFLVDGRDYFWALSEALLMAEDVIYIHDWWLSPELYMRRPVNGNQEFRIDRILKRKAEKGIKVFIVVYRNVGTTVGTDSSWTKHSMLNLHPNIHLIRSPNQWLQNTYFWAHHEKMTVIDNTIAFMGGIDLCYGRYDTPEHSLCDDHANLKDQIFPGKDYSNARICDFFDLDKPFESMYDRSKIPRMPWHDVHTMTIGEAARDMARHFVQRWNYLLRQKRPSRPTPLLTPPSDFTRDEIENSSFFKMLKPRSTCEVQVLRSAGNWSLGLKETEKSIQNAYLKLIETSEHYIYIENQFFITASQWDGVVIENKVGDAIVDRIIRANSEGKVWKAFILIPLMPGFDSPIDQPEASSVRVIMQCQYQSISRGETSIFSKLKKLNIDPMQYIQFYSLRKWSTIGPNKKLVTEQLYVHGKVLIVDDRSCIIGSANINERSQLGCRDSEVAMLIRDTDLVKSKMDDGVYYAGRFALELRKRLMREHLGCNVDLVEVVERKFGRLETIARNNYKELHLLAEDSTKNDKLDSAMLELAYREIFDVDYSDPWKSKYSSLPNVNSYGISHPFSKPSNEECFKNDFDDLQRIESDNKKTALPDRRTKTKANQNLSCDGLLNYHTFNYRAGEENIGIRDNKPISTDPRLTNNKKHQEDVDGFGLDGWKHVTKHFKKNVTEQLRAWATAALGKNKNSKGSLDFLPEKNDIEQYLQEESITSEQKWDMLKRICYLQHLSYKNRRNAAREKDASSEVSGNAGSDGHNGIHKLHQDILKEQELDDRDIDELLEQLAPNFTEQDDSQKELMNLKFIDPYSFDDPLSVYFYDDLWFSVALRNTLLFRLVFHCQPDNAVQSWRDYKEYNRLAEEFSESQDQLIEIEMGSRSTQSTTETQNSREDAGDGELPLKKDTKAHIHKGIRIADIPQNELHETGLDQEPTKRDMDKERRSKATALKMRLSGSLLYGTNQRIFDKFTARRILERLHGHLVIFPTEWLSREVESKNWFYNVDRLAPIEIFD